MYIYFRLVSISESTLWESSFNKRISRCSEESVCERVRERKGKREIINRSLFSVAMACGNGSLLSFLSLSLSLSLLFFFLSFSHTYKRIYMKIMYAHTCKSLSLPPLLTPYLTPPITFPLSFCLYISVKSHQTFLAASSICSMFLTLTTVILAR